MSPRDRSSTAFTRIELVAVLATVALVIAVVIAPALASNKSDSERLVCFNNLRLIGRAVQMWAGVHNGNPPWRVPVAEGGTFAQFKPGLAYFEYSVVSNELVTPKILACPSDVGVRRALDFSGFSDRSGLYSAPFRNNAISYVVGLEAVGAVPRSLLAADRNLRFDGNSSGCSSGINNTRPVAPTSLVVGWTNGAVHGDRGHALLHDGSVEFTSSSRFRTLVGEPRVDDNGSVHLLAPR